MNRENFINSLRTDLLAMVQDYLSPVAMKYGYSEAPLETNIKWKPLVLVLGNYSSGKSTLINDFLGAAIQDTGQAPTDDSFTVLTYDGSASAEEPVRVNEERDGKFLLNDPEYPFDTLKKHGQRFTAHFRLKKINSPFLRNLAIIDTPGMLDSITERDRGYNYQEVIGDFAQIADLVLVLFDPHKAGTVREAHTSLRETLPARTFEDRVLFVLNRIDECASLVDLLHVYGTLCWNLSQITGRKDIPTIHLTYSPSAKTQKTSMVAHDIDFLKLLENQREELKRAILQAPRHRLDHLAAFVETHGERLLHLIESLMSYRRHVRRYRIKYVAAGLIVAVLGAALAETAFMKIGMLPLEDAVMVAAVGGLLSVVILLLWITTLQRYFFSRFRKKKIKQVDELTSLDNQTRRDSWETIRELVKTQIKKPIDRLCLRDLAGEYDSVKMVFNKGAKDIREALNQLSAINHNDAIEMEKWIDNQTKLLRKTV
jgi:GTPase SAR1 family protein